MRRNFGPRVFVEPGQRGLVGPGNAQQAVGKHALGIGQMAQHLFHAPFAVGIAEIALGLWQATQLFKLGHLGGEERQRAAVADRGDVAGVKGRELSFSGAGDSHGRGPGVLGAWGLSVGDSSVEATLQGCLARGTSISDSASSVWTPCTSEGNCGTRTRDSLANRRSISSR